MLLSDVPAEANCEDAACVLNAVAGGFGRERRSTGDSKIDMKTSRPSGMRPHNAQLCCERVK
jgi:hypothetical protein